MTSTAAFTGSTAPTSCTGTSNRTAYATVTYDEEVTETTDPAGKIRQDTIDGLGRPVQVTEDPSGLDYDTLYAYDPVGHLLEVTQGSQTRTFEYSSPGWLIEATNPENGTISYSYNDDGTPYQVTDARSITTTMSYDALGRVTGVDYSDSTPDVTYSYYTSGTNRIGRLQSVSSSTATETFSAYDALGRVTSHTQEIVNNSNDYTLSYTYRLDNSIATMTYPSGREVDYTTDNAGRIRTVDDGAITFADLSGDTTDIDPLGRIANMALGNGLWEARDYRPAGTDTELKLGTSEGGSQRLELGYSYSGTANNGNLTNHTITHPGPTTYFQSFTYDGVNRLDLATETNGFVRDYEYDQYGNRWLDPMNTDGPETYDSHEPTASTNFSTSTNRLNVASSTYDNAGNQTFFTPYTLTFDAANHITAAESASNGDMYYGYDGSGRRVGKSWTPQGGSEVLTYYIYDIAGRLAAEYTDGDPGTPELSYVFPDILGSIRAVTDDAGDVTECYDYTPFGRMLTSEDNDRSSVGCYPGSPTSYTTDLRDKFTGQQRDEDRLDYFIARYYADGQGRFTGVDPLSGWVTDAQSWNGYAYARNNPLRYVDPTGMTYDVCRSDREPDECNIKMSDSDFLEWINSSQVWAVTDNYWDIGTRGWVFGYLHGEDIHRYDYTHTWTDDPTVFLFDPIARDALVTGSPPGPSIGPDRGHRVTTDDKIGTPICVAGALVTAEGGLISAGEQKLATTTTRAASRTATRNAGRALKGAGTVVAGASAALSAVEAVDNFQNGNSAEGAMDSIDTGMAILPLFFPEVLPVSVGWGIGRWLSGC